MIAGVVPCAGSSSRRGKAKALLSIGDSTFVQAVVDALSDGGCEPVLAIVPDDRVVAEAARVTGARVLTNADPGEGPITSMRLALRELGDSVEGVIYMAVDHPCVRAETIATIVDVARSTDAPLVIPTYEGERGHPSFFQQSLFLELMDPTLGGGARTVVHRHLALAELVAVPDPGIRLDIDTPAEYEAMLAAGIDAP